MLTSAEYDAREREALRHTPNRVIEAYQPAGFNRVGYPTRVETADELYRFAEVMHEGTPPDLLPRMLGALSAHELDLVRQVTKTGSDVVWSLSGRRVVASSSVLPAVLAYRHILGIYPDRRATILEIGPGDGYLGALLIAGGFGYIGTDVAQAFYLLQSNFFERLAGPGFVELAGDSRGFEAFSRVESGMAIHVPWWKFASANPERLAVSIDCVVGSGVFCEMHPRAFGYLAFQSARWLAGGDRREKLFYMHGPGAEGANTIAAVRATLTAAGIDFVHADKLGASDRDVSIDIGYFFMPRDRAASRRETFGRWLVAERAKWSAGDPGTFDVLRRHLAELAGGTPLETDDQRFTRFCATGMTA